MPELVRLELLPLGHTLEVERGSPLAEVLFAEGVEFPCGGRGRCKGCRVRVLEGELPVADEDQQKLTAVELADGWRLACRARADQHLKLELAQWEAPVLTDHSAFAFAPREGLGIAVDVGTTTLVAQLLDLRTGHVLGVSTALNPQAQHGADIMSRIEFALSGDGQGVLERLIRTQIGQMVGDLLVAANRPAAELTEVVLVGNTVMHHLFCGVSVEPLSHHPFVPQADGEQAFPVQRLGWPLSGPTRARFLGCLGGFVGSDILAGILATRLHESERLAALVDLGTNGEIVVGDRHRLLCASTAAGPAFEGARISMGMRAATGAISEVTLREGQFHCRVLGHGPPRGICGSGLVDAAAAALELGRVHPSGKLADGQPLSLAGPVTLTQWDVRELQLAKGAIAAGIRLLLGQWGASPEDLTCLYLAGAFGNYINRASARRIGLLEFPLHKVRPAGNTALLGAKLALFDPWRHAESFAGLRRRIRHVPLNEDPRFHEIYVDQMGFAPPPG